MNSFSEYIVNNEIIKFGDFTLKSGRKSPYFFNFGSFHNGMRLWDLGEFYADYIYENKIEFDVIFGSAYKGIPIALATTFVLNKKYKMNIDYVFNRKEEKSYGDNGKFIGAEIKSRKVLALDDVLTSGKTVLETIEMIREANGELVGYLVALDRQENGIDSNILASHFISQKYNLNIYSISSIRDVIDSLKNVNRTSECKRLEEYLARNN
ncbi:orotate phosphoribosyltransferase (plasmid) [Macrococcus psychrotolerans]|uniref:Orotate phosphoribosyltransferase n=1 Tax=Macrococcus psychrotolerans TaxID=3039389 RepID=A0AAT9P743_9STAP|nr:MULTISPECIES: orotate phosphoribosyltransferase [Macrococcus]QYA34075.1 orotate phosphoribosyltransferase [Macrococcus sp. 19Msa1099]QYA38860.1 orotate phosphoribosyltransferase [Macrococcus caseolyticus]QYA77583.1 orotate phosphoribosyltransferase [Macrococcus caseolyticus]